jgi:LCP family protein required for cell wall assembly
VQAQAIQARVLRPSTGAADRRRIVAAFLSALYPGLGQAFNRDGRSVLLFALPITALTLLGIALAQAFGSELLVMLLKPDTVVAILALNVLLLCWRLGAVGQAWVSGARGPVGKIGVVGLLVVATLALIPQVAGGLLAYRLYQTTSAVCIGCTSLPRSMADDARDAPTPRPLFAGDDPGRPAATPERTGRTNILLLGIDSRPSRDHALADSIIVASIDPVGKTVSMLSIPRDLVDIPLPTGDTYGRKINTLMGYVNAHPDDPDFAFAQRSGTRALLDAVGELLGIPIHYYAKVDLPGFIKVIDAVGGVDIDVTKKLHAPGYRDFGVFGFSVDPGPHHFDGKEALAYARIRRAPGESDFTRAARQQEVLMAVRDAALRGGALGLLSRLDGLLSALEGAIRTDVPPERFGDFAFLAEQIEQNKVTNVVLLAPLFRARTDSRGYVQIPDLEAIREMSAALFPSPGIPPQAWPGPDSSPGPDAAETDSGG